MIVIILCLPHVMHAGNANKMATIGISLGVIGVIMVSIMTILVVIVLVKCKKTPTTETLPRKYSIDVESTKNFSFT